MPFPTPDNPTTDDYTFVGLAVHKSPPDLQGNISGAISQLFEPYFFEKYGEMSPEEAAEYYRNQFWVMDICSLVADCITNSEDVKVALSNYFSEYFSGASSLSLTNPISPDAALDNLLPDDYTCDDDHLMGMARYMVQQLHATSLELIQELEVSTTVVEFIALLSDNIEIVSYLGALPEIVSWLQDNVVDFYEAAYTQVVEDEIACNLWCAFREDCNVSVQTIINGYTRVFTNASLTPPETDDYNVIMDWIMTLLAMPDLILVSAVHWLALQSLRFRSKFALLSGVRTLEQLVIMGSDETDTSHSLCASCDPEPPSPIYMDYRTGQLGSYLFGSSPGSYVTNEGYAYYNGQFWERSSIKHDNLGNLTMSEVRIYQYRLQVNGYGANSAVRIRLRDSAGSLIVEVNNRWDSIQYYDGIPYRVFPLAGTYNNVDTIEVFQNALNTASVGTWRFYGWGYTE